MLELVEVLVDDGIGEDGKEREEREAQWLDEQID